MCGFCFDARVVLTLLTINLVIACFLRVGSIVLKRFEGFALGKSH